MRTRSLLIFFLEDQGPQEAQGGPRMTQDDPGGTPGKALLKLVLMEFQGRQGRDRRKARMTMGA